MRNKLRLTVLCCTVLSASVLFVTNAFAQELPYHQRSYDTGYDEGYDDGYDDAMEDCPCPPEKISLSAYSGLYIGVQGSYNSNLFNRDIKVNEEPFGSFKTSANGWGASLYGGYGYVFTNKMYLGGEGYIGTSNAGGHDTVQWGMWSYNGTVSTGTTYGLAVKPGYQLGDSIGYLRFGYNSMDVRMTETSPLNGNSSKSGYVSGWSYGVGIETKLCKQWSLRTEFNHIEYDSLTNSATGSKVTPSDNQGSLGLSYHFRF